MQSSPAVQSKGSFLELRSWVSGLDDFSILLVNSWCCCPFVSDLAQNPFVSSGCLKLCPSRAAGSSPVFTRTGLQTCTAYQCFSQAVHSPQSQCRARHILITGFNGILLTSVNHPQRLKHLQSPGKNQKTAKRSGFCFACQAIKTGHLWPPSPGPSPRGTHTD